MRGGLTTSEYPVFWVFVPDSHKNIKKAQFVLQVEDETSIEEIARIDYDLKQAPGLIKIELPQEEKYKFKTGDLIYRWYFRIICDNRNSQAVGGQVKRITLDHFSQDNYESYLENRIWYDALTDLAKRYSENPDDLYLKNQWASLLEAIGVNLGQLAEESRFGAIEIRK